MIPTTTHKKKTLDTLKLTSEIKDGDLVWVKNRTTNWDARIFKAWTKEGKAVCHKYQCANSSKNDDLVIYECCKPLIDVPFLN